LYADFNGSEPDPDMSLTVGQTLAYIHLNAHYARTAALDALKDIETVKATVQALADQPAATVDLDKLADLMMAKLGHLVAQGVADEMARRLQE
jgi:hypothetical protein